MHTFYVATPRTEYVYTHAHAHTHLASIPLYEKAVDFGAKWLMTLWKASQLLV